MGVWSVSKGPSAVIYSAVDLKNLRCMATAKSPIVTGESNRAEREGRIIGTDVGQEFFT
jgi:hypothetical protein